MIHHLLTPNPTGSMGTRPVCSRPAHGHWARHTARAGQCSSAGRRARGTAASAGGMLIRRRHSRDRRHCGRPFQPPIPDALQPAAHVNGPPQEAGASGRGQSAPPRCSGLCLRLSAIAIFPVARWLKALLINGNDGMIPTPCSASLVGMS